MTSSTPKLRLIFKKYDIAIFYILSLLITWTGWFILDRSLQMIPANAQLDQLLSDGRYDIILVSLLLNILSIISVWGPLLSAFIVYRVNYGKAGTRALLKKIFNWRVAFPWYIIAFGVPTLIKYGTFYFNVWFLGGTIISDFERVSILAIFLTFLDELIPSGGQEEVGWTGFAQLRLQQKMPVIPATLTKALMGWIWHLPLYFVFTWSGIFGSDIWFFLVYYVALAFIYTWIFNNTDSILIPALFHATFNTIGTYALTTSTSWENVSISLVIFCAIAYLVVIIAFIRDGKNLTRKELPALQLAIGEDMKDSGESGIFPEESKGTETTRQ